jgi:TPR repeat protein
MPANFSTGEVYVNDGVNNLINAGLDIRPHLSHHQAGDYGNITQEELDTNLRSLTEGGQILSKYSVDSRTTICFLTTTSTKGNPFTRVMLLEDYEKELLVKETAKQYRKAANEGDADAQLSLALMYVQGEGVSQDVLEAYKLFSLAAAQGNACAAYNLGMMHKKGMGCLKNFEEAAKWIQKAAESGFKPALCQMGILYDDGQGVPKDAKKAIEWYRKAAEQGDVQAQNNLGAIYAEGSGVAKNTQEAIKWFQMAAAQGNINAQINLGSIYEEGNGVPQNIEEAVKWYKKAAAQGSIGAHEKLIEIEASKYTMDELNTILKSKAFALQVSASLKQEILAFAEQGGWADTHYLHEAQGLGVMAQVGFGYIKFESVRRSIRYRIMAAAKSETLDEAVAKFNEKMLAIFREDLYNPESFRSGRAPELSRKLQQILEKQGKELLTFIVISLMLGSASHLVEVLEGKTLEPEHESPSKSGSSGCLVIFILVAGMIWLCM